MSMTEETTAPVPKPKKRRKTKKRAARAVAAPKKVADGIYAGLSVKDCCNACNADGCVISGKFYCAHPRKSGLHAAEQQDAGALARRREAEKFLGKQKLRVED